MDDEEWKPPIERPLVGVKTHGVFYEPSAWGSTPNWALDARGRTWRGTREDAEKKADTMNRNKHPTDMGWAAERLTPAMQEDETL